MRPYTAPQHPPGRAGLRSLGVMLLSLLLAGCIGNEREDTTRFYLLGEDSAATALSAAPGAPPALDIAALRLPQYLQRPQIVTRTSANEIVLAEYEQWGGNLAKNMMRVLARNLARLLATPEITIFSRRPARPADVRVEIDVLQFERGPDGRVLLAAQWRLRGGADDALVVRLTELASPALPADAGMQATVSAMSTLWGEFARIVATAIVDRAFTKPA